jgi:hypothetical protein
MPDVLDDLETYWAAATRNRSHLDGRVLIEAAEAPLVLADVGPDERRRRWRVLSIAALVVAAVGLAALLLTDHDDRAERIGVADDHESTDGTVATSDDGDTTTEPSAVPDLASEDLQPPPPIGSIPDASLEGHPQQSFYEDDPEGQSLAEAFRQERETGWVAVQLDPEHVGWVPLDYWQRSGTGSVSEVANGDGAMVGYYIQSLGFVDTETFESPDFDWRAWARSIPWFPPEIIEQDIRAIEDAGGLGDVYRLPDIEPPPGS